MEIQKRGGSVTKDELYKIWKELGRDPRGLGGFFRGNSALIAEGAGGKVFITKHGEEELKKYLSGGERC